MAFPSPAITPVVKDSVSTTQPLKRKNSDVVSKVSAPKRLCLALTACPRRGVSLTVGTTRKVGSLTGKALYSTTAPLRWVLRKTLKRGAVKDAEAKKQQSKKAEEPTKAEEKNQEGTADASKTLEEDNRKSSSPSAAAGVVEERIVETHVEAIAAVAASAVAPAVAPEVKQDMFAAAFQEESATIVEKPAKAQKKGGSKKGKKAATIDNQKLTQAGA